MTRLLYLLRHAKAETPQLGKNDARRTLTGRGRRAAAALGRWSVTAGVDPDLVVTSPAARAVQTAEGWTQAAGRAQIPVEYRDAIYQASPGTLLALVQELNPTLRAVMLVGHNPGFSELASHLAGELIELRTCALAAFELSGEWAATAPPRARLRYVHVPDGRRRADRP